MDTSEAGLRLFVQQGGCAGLSYGMRFDDAPDEDDTIYTHHELRVFVDPASMKYIEGSILDYESGLQAEGSTSRIRTWSANVAVASRSERKRCPVIST